MMLEPGFSVLHYLYEACETGSRVSCSDKLDMKYYAGRKSGVKAGILKNPGLESVSILEI
jgi:hypothetical protein